jgi:hypothetical protein
MELEQVTQRMGEKCPYRAREAHEVACEVIHHVRTFFVSVFLAIAIRSARGIKCHTIQGPVAIQRIGDFVLRSSPQSLGV